MKFKHLKDLSAAEPANPEQSQAEFAIYAAELGNEAPAVDLHGLDKNLALHTLDSFLNHEFSGRARRDVKAVKIIHGRGEGILRQAIQEHLKNIPFIVRFRNSENLRQADAVTWVALAPNTK